MDPTLVNVPLIHTLRVFFIRNQPPYSEHTISINAENRYKVRVSNLNLCRTVHNHASEELKTQLLMKFLHINELLFKDEPPTLEEYLSWCANYPTERSLFIYHLTNAYYNAVPIAILEMSDNSNLTDEICQSLIEFFSKNPSADRPFMFMDITVSPIKFSYKYPHILMHVQKFGSPELKAEITKAFPIFGSVPTTSVEDIKEWCKTQPERIGDLTKTLALTLKFSTPAVCIIVRPLNPQ